MTYEEREVVEPADTVNTVPAETEVVRPRTVVEPAPVHRTVVSDDPVGNAFAASQMIQTIVWAIVVIVLLIVALLILHRYTGIL